MRSATWNVCLFNASHFCWSLKMLNETSIILTSLTSWIPRTKVRSKIWICHDPRTKLAETSSSPSVGRLQKANSAIVRLCHNTIEPTICHCGGCWRMIPHKWEMISHNSKPRGYLAAGEWFHTNGKWSHKQATRQKRWVGWILNEIFMVIN